MGNGDEASGDGYRYRGRGLIQLTGKTNYQAFSNGIGEDLAANPDAVADRLAAHSAVFYWATNGLNALADTDDLAAVTKRINGGLIGFADRRLLLEKAKRVLSALQTDTAGPPAALTPNHRVTPPNLNLRRTPGVSPGNLIAALAQGTLVEALAGTQAQGWIEVRVLLNGVLRQGFVSSQYLEPLPRARGRGLAGAAPCRRGAPDLSGAGTRRCRPQRRRSACLPTAPCRARPGGWGAATRPTPSGGTLWADGEARQWYCSVV